MAQKVTGYVKLQIPAGKATPAPPVGPALGQHGVNIAAFTKEFNERTKNDAVSYTHLDVYKRQVRNSSPPWTARKNWRPSISSSWRNCLRTRTNKGVQTQITPARCVMVSF